jgi:restriction endonuclease Mrr
LNCGQDAPQHVAGRLERVRFTAALACPARGDKAISSFPCALGLNHKHGLCKQRSAGYLAAMSTVQEIEAAIPKLSRAELEQFHAWYEDFVEDQFELSDAVKAKLDESRREIAAGHCTTRQPA